MYTMYSICWILLISFSRRVNTNARALGRGYHVTDIKKNKETVKFSVLTDRECYINSICTGCDRVRCFHVADTTGRGPSGPYIYCCCHGGQAKTAPPGCSVTFNDDPGALCDLGITPRVGGTLTSCNNRLICPLLAPVRHQSCLTR